MAGTGRAVVVSQTFTAILKALAVQRAPAAAAGRTDLVYAAARGRE